MRDLAHVLARPLADLLAGELAGRLVVRHHQRGDRLAVAGRQPDHRHFLYVGRVAVDLLELVRVHVLARRPQDHLLDPPDDDELPAVVEAAQVSGVQPAFAQHLRRRVLVLVVAEHHVRPLGQHLADAALVRVRDLDVDAGQRAAHAAGHRLLARALGGDDRRRLGHAVALVQLEAEPEEVLHHVGRQRGAAADEQAQAPAQLAVDREEQDLAQVEPVRHPVAQAAVEVDDSLEGALDERSALAHPLGDLAVQELPQRRHADHAGDAAVLERARQGVGVDLLEVGHLRAVDQRHEQPGRELEGVVQRQDREQAVVAVQVEQRRQLRHHRGEVLVRQHHALGRAGRARGVDDGGQLLALAHRREGGRRHRRLDQQVVEADQLQPRRGALELLGAETLDDRVRRDHAGGAAGGDQAHQLLERQLMVERDRGGPGLEDAEVADAPLRPVLRHQHDAVVDSHAALAQPGRGLRRHVLHPLVGVDHRLAVVGLERQEAHGDPVAVQLGGGVEQLEQVLVGVDRARALAELVVQHREHPLHQAGEVSVEPVVAPVDGVDVPGQRLAILGRQPPVERRDVVGAERDVAVVGERLEQVHQLGHPAGELGDLAQLVLDPLGQRVEPRRAPARHPLVDLRQQPVGQALDARGRLALEGVAVDREALQPRADAVLERTLPVVGQLAAVLADGQRGQLGQAAARDHVHAARGQLVDRLVLAADHSGGRHDHAGGHVVDRDDVERRVPVGDDLPVALEHQVDQRRGGVEALVPPGERVAHRRLDDGRSHHRRPSRPARSAPAARRATSCTCRCWASPSARRARCRPGSAARAPRACARAPPPGAATPRRPDRAPGRPACGGRARGTPRCGRGRWRGS